MGFQVGLPETDLKRQLVLFVCSFVINTAFDVEFTFHF